MVSAALRAIPNPLVNEAVTVTVLAGITGSASGGMSIALAAMSDIFIEAAKAAKYPARSIASYRGHGERWHGYITSQRGRYHAACRYGSHPQAGL
jgi:H+/gluconate symporter-like permease